MKRNTYSYIVLCIITLLLSCKSNSTSTFNSEKLRGKYKVDITPMIAEATKGSNNSNQLARGIVGLTLSSLELELNFYENNKGIFHIDGGIINFFAAMNDGEEFKKTQEFDYKIENDSILFLRTEKETDFNKIGYIKKVSDSYDFIKIITEKESGEKYELGLKKIIE